jgi:hypothetical protein
MSRHVKCDRCGKFEEIPFRNETLPFGWEKVSGSDLCDKCTRAFHEFLRPVLQIAAPPKEKHEH